MGDDAILIGLDVGTGRIKAAAFDISGQQVSSASTATPVRVPEPGWADYDADALWDAAAGVIRETAEMISDAGRVSGIAVASMGEAGVFIDNGGRPTSEILAWYCGRTADMPGHLGHLDRDAVFASTGLPPRHIYSAMKMLWLKANVPEAIPDGAKWLNVADYIAYRLSGECATDYSLASRMMTFRLADRRWDEGLLNEMGLGSHLLAQPVPSGTRIGSLTAEASRQTGLPSHAAVCAGGHDHICGALTADVIRPGEVLNSLGTAEAVFRPTEHTLADPLLGHQGYTVGAHVYPETSYVLGGIFSSGGSVEWFCNLFPHADRDELLQALIEEASQAPRGCLGTRFTPHLRLAGAPFGDEVSRGAFVGLSADADRGILFRAVLEGLNFSMRQVLDGMDVFEGMVPASRITAIGGGTRNALLLRIKSAVLNRPVEKLATDEAAAMGAAILAGIGSGVFESADAALQAFKQASDRVHVDPDDASFYGAAYEQYRKIHPILHHLHTDTGLTDSTE